MIRVCQVVASINRDIGGPAVSVPRLASALAGLDVGSAVASLDYAVHGPQAAVPGASMVTRRAGALTRGFRGWNPDFQRALRDHALQGADLIHNHGLWMWPNAYARQASVAAGIPLVISPRGMLEAWSLGRSRLRKFVAWRLFESQNLAAARLFHATSVTEAESLRTLGFRQPVAVVPNGVDLPELEMLPDRSGIEARYPALRDRRWLVFMSRLHEKKGVMELLRAWSELAGRFPDWHLILAGPDLDGFGVRLKGEIESNGLGHCVTVPGALEGSAKAAVLGGADVFVLPTFSENFGIVVAEAMAHAVPVITTHGAPWQVLETERCGWWIEMGHARLVSALEDAMRLGIDDRRAMGQRGRRVVERDFSWARIAAEMLGAYQWLLGTGPLPACVRRG